MSSATAHETIDVAALRVGMFGGAFDPPHWAHRSLAETALSQLALDVLHILPTGQAWHKSRTLTPSAHRVAMCELAFAGLCGVRVFRYSGYRVLRCVAFFVRIHFD